MSDLLISPPAPLPLPPRGGPVQTAVFGLHTCVQSSCSQGSCNKTGMTLQCVDEMDAGRDMVYQGTYMECDGDKQSNWTYFSCKCVMDKRICHSAIPTPTATSGAPPSIYYGRSMEPLVMIGFAFFVMRVFKVWLF